MSSARSRVGLHLAFWYASLFIASALAIVILTYYLTAGTLAARDQQILRSKAGEYAVVYGRGGFQALTTTVRAEQAVEPERLFVRVVDRGVEAIVLSQPRGWDPDQIELESIRLGDGTLVQVGKSSEARRDLLRRLRVALGIVTLVIVVIGLAGGRMATETALIPIRNLATTVRRIIETGRPDVRVPIGDAVRGGSGEDDGVGSAKLATRAEAAPVPSGPRTRHDDAIDELAVLVNQMLDRIQRLVEAMRGSLDNVSHDLRTPLARLRSTAEFALTGPADVERYRDALTTCVEETDRTLVMLDTLMDISEAESGAMQLRREPVDVRAIIDRAIELYREVAEHEQVWLGVDDRSTASEPMLVSGDRTRLEQVAANLIDNAIKYTSPGGRVEVALAADGTSAVFDVRDTGAGIPPDELPRIWDRLFRGDRSRGARGLGLGLSLVKAIVEAHGGTASAHSQVGVGSTFTVRLPLWRAT